MTETAQPMRDHWWWRPGWRVGRSFSTWHVTFDDQPAVHRLAADYAPILNDLPTLDPIPVRWLPVRPAEPVTRLRAAIRAAIADVWGPDNVPEDPHGFRPHVSLAYSNAASPAEPITQRLGARSVTAAEITVHRAALIDLNRDHRAYEWNDIATADLSAPHHSKIF
jgi:2'-5' RNA ligase superfamily